MDQNYKRISVNNNQQFLLIYINFKIASQVDNFYSKKMN